MPPCTSNAVSHIDLQIPYTPILISIFLKDCIISGYLNIEQIIHTAKRALLLDVELL
jgi:hypothetical protein